MSEQNEDKGFKVIDRRVGAEEPSEEKTADLGASTEEARTESSAKAAPIVRVRSSYSSRSVGGSGIARSATWKGASTSSALARAYPSRKTVGPKYGESTSSTP